MNKAYSKSLKKYGALSASVLLAGSKVANAQIVYTDIPDEIVDGNSVFIDLNDDMVNDFEIIQETTSYGTYTGISTYGFTASNVVKQDHSTFGVELATALSASDNISSGSEWSTANYSLGLQSNSYFGGDIGYFGGQGDKYIGVRFDISGSVHYGWILVNVASDASSTTVKSYAYNTTPNESLEAGQTSIVSSVSPELENSLTLYPNPTSDILNVKADGVESIAIIDGLGNQVIEEESKSSVNISDLVPGLYTAVISTINGAVVKQFVKK